MSQPSPRNRRIGLSKILALALGLSLVVVAFMDVEQPPHDRRTLNAVDQLGGQYMNMPVPADFTFRDQNGKLFSLEQLRGKVVFLNLWAHWCEPCRTEMPSMLQLAKTITQEYGFDLSRNAPMDSDDFVMVAISWDTDVDKLTQFIDTFPSADFIKKKNLQINPSSLLSMRQSMVIGHDPDGLQTRQLGTRKIPESYLIDREGRIVARFQNAREWSSPQAMNLIHTLIRQR